MSKSKFKSDKNKQCMNKKNQQETSAAGGDSLSYQRLSLTHNPFSIETSITVDNREVTDVWFTSLIQNEGVAKRFQLFLPELVERMGQKYPNCQLEFNGVKGDYEDLSIAIENNPSCRLKLQAGRIADINDVYKNLETQVGKLSESPIQDYRSLNFEKELEAITDRKLYVSILAPMNTGKSTLINAMLGQDLLPSKDSRCTSKITRIRAISTNAPYQCKKILKSGESGPYCAATIDLLNDWNIDDNVSSIEIKGQLPRFQSEQSDVIEADLHFVDTPGYGSATNPEDDILVDKLLIEENHSLVCFVLEDLNDIVKNYLKKIKDKIDSLGNQSEDRFLFVISKVDELGDEMDRGETSFTHNPLAEKIEAFKIGLKILGFKNPKIFPVMAKQARNVRTVSLKDCSRKQLRDMEDVIDLFYSKIENHGIFEYASISSAMKKKLRSELPQGDASDESRYLSTLTLSGITALEDTIREYLEKYMLPARIHDAHERLTCAIAQIDVEAALNIELREREAGSQKLSEEIENLQNMLLQHKFHSDKAGALETRMYEPSKAFKQRIASYASNIENVATEFNGLINNNHSGETIPKKRAVEYTSNFTNRLKNSVADVSQYITKTMQNEMDDKIKQIENDFEECIDGSSASKELKKLVSSITNQQFAFAFRKSLNIRMDEIQVPKNRFEQIGDFISPLVKSVSFGMLDTSVEITVRKLKFQAELENFARQARQECNDRSIADMKNVKYPQILQIVRNILNEINDAVQSLLENIKEKEQDISKQKETIITLKQRQAWLKKYKYDIDSSLKV